MTIDEKYDIFCKKYWEGVDEIKKTSERCAAILYKYGAPLTKEEWLKSEFNDQNHSSIEAGEDFNS